MQKLHSQLSKRRKRLLRDIRMAQVMHPEMRGSLEGFSVELLLMDSKLNRVLAPEFSLEADEFATIQLVKKAIKSAELLQSTCLVRVSESRLKRLFSCGGNGKHRHKVDN